MFEVFAGMCFYTALAVRQCDDYIVESYDDQLTCEIVANDYGQKDGLRRLYREAYDYFRWWEIEEANSKIEGLENLV